MYNDILDQSRRIRNKENIDKSILEKKDRKQGASHNFKEFEQNSDKAIELIMYNKINAKNAFDVNVEFLQNLPFLLNKNEESSWQRASASLDASAKIYGYRVDSVHNETFKFLGGLARADHNTNENNEDGQADDEKRPKRERPNRHEGFCTLEKDTKKLDLVKFDVEFEVDPLFKSMTAKFNDSGARSLLLNNLELDEKLDLLLESKTPEQKLNEKKIDSKSTLELSTEIRDVMLDVLKGFTVNDLKSAQICPDLNYFKKSRELETSNEKTFYNNLLSEMDETMFRDLNTYDEPIVIDGDSLNDSGILNDNIDGNMSMMSQHSFNIESPYDGKYEDNMVNFNNNMMNADTQHNHPGMSFVEGFSCIKADDMKEYLTSFGDGNKNIFRNFSQYQNFAKSFNQLDKNTNLFKANLNEVQTKRVKKEEKLFEFSIENEVKPSEIISKESKIKKDVGNNQRKDKKKKVKQFYNYDKTMLFNLYTIGDRQSRTHFNDNKLDDLPGEYNNNKEEFNLENNHISIDEDDFAKENENINFSGQNLQKFDHDYEKKFGNLYKTFDVRFVKAKLWESISKEEMKQTNKIEFKEVVESMSKQINKNMLDSISTSTCFVCLLHLCNEKVLSLEDMGENNFSIKTSNKHF